MEWLVNDLSLDGQFAHPAAVRTALEPLLKLRMRDNYLLNNLYTSRRLIDRQATATANLREAVKAIKTTNLQEAVKVDKNFIKQVLSWLANSHFFWETNSQPDDYDHFEFEGEEVTEQGLGEAARRLLAGRETRSFSFQDIQKFEKTPLSVQHGFSDDPPDQIIIDNDWRIDQLESVLQGVRKIESWPDVQVEIRRRFAEIMFPETVMEKMTPVPFSKALKERIYVLLGVLNRLVQETGPDGKLTPGGMEIWLNRSTGARAWFTDESETNKINFKTELTFVDPANAGKAIFCPWHGKINEGPTRIHFEWPRPPGQRQIKVVYIGPKITKK
ncbi:MAG: hypothetical protein HQK60_06940 [Deltaproteobacteria bacterium]|nr:hypothetical protein [Deltaproteobacteria bacterium]